MTDETEHNVTLTKGFYLGKYEVTQAQYEAVTGSNPSEFNATGNGNRPVEKVTWTEAVAFCTQLTTQEQNAGRLPAGWAYVLPTESQWECLSGGNDHGVLMGQYDHQLECELQLGRWSKRRKRLQANSRRRAIRGQPVNFLRHARERLGVDRRWLSGGVSYR